MCNAQAGLLLDGACGTAKGRSAQRRPPPSVGRPPTDRRAAIACPQPSPLCLAAGLSSITPLLHPYAGKVVLEGGGGRNLVDSPAACCAACKQRTDCNVWTWCSAPEGERPGRRVRGCAMSGAAWQRRSLSAQRRAGRSLASTHDPPSAFLPCPPAGCDSGGQYRECTLKQVGDGIDGCSECCLSLVLQRLLLPLRGCCLLNHPTASPSRPPAQDWKVASYKRAISRSTSWVSGWVSTWCPGTDPYKLLALQARRLLG